jgi:hypothetical protein
MIEADGRAVARGAAGMGVGILAAEKLCRVNTAATEFFPRRFVRYGCVANAAVDKSSIEVSDAS